MREKPRECHLSRFTGSAPMICFPKKGLTVRRGRTSRTGSGSASGGRSARPSQARRCPTANPAARCAPCRTPRSGPRCALQSWVVVLGFWGDFLWLLGVRAPALHAGQHALLSPTQDTPGRSRSPCLFAVLPPPWPGHCAAVQRTTAARGTGRPPAGGLQPSTGAYARGGGLCCMCRTRARSVWTSFTLMIRLFPVARDNS